MILILVTQKAIERERLAVLVEVRAATEAVHECFHPANPGSWQLEATEHVRTNRSRRRRTLLDELRLVTQDVRQAILTLRAGHFDSQIIERTG